MPRLHHPSSVGTTGSALEQRSASHSPAVGQASSNGSRDLEHLERAVTIALSPLDYSDPAAWGEALTAALCTLGNADAGAFLLPGVTSWHEVPRHARAHDEVTERLPLGDARDLVLWARDDLAGSTVPLPNAIGASTVGIRIRTGTGEVAAFCVRRGRVAVAAPLDLLAALRAISPALRAGVAAWVSANASRANVARMLDSLADPALVFDLHGTLVHANPAAERLTASTGASSLRGEAQRVAWTLSAMARRSQPSTSDSGSAPTTSTSRRLPLAGMVHNLRASIVGGQLLGTEPAVLVTITVAAPEPLSDDALHAEYGLTARERQVARLVAEGLSNNEIAARLGVRFFTARNHVERTLAKLGVASRNRVGPLLRNELQEPAASAA